MDLLRYARPLRNLYIGLGVALLVMGVAKGGCPDASHPPPSAPHEQPDASGSLIVTTFPAGAPESVPLAPTRCGLARFGATLASDGARLLVGATAREPRDGRAEACLYERRPTGWALKTGFRRPENGAYDDLGTAVAMASSWVALNQPGHENGDAAVRLFREGDDGFAPAGLAVDPVNGGAEQSYWSESLAVAGAELFVGNVSAGAVHVFSLPTPDAEVRRLVPSGGGHGDFGLAIAADGDTLVVGAPSAARGSRAGTVEVFGPNGDGGWRSTGVLTGTAGHLGDEFGAALALSDHLLVVGAPEVEMSGAGRADGHGYAEVFRFDGRSWRSVAVLRPTDPRPSGWFGDAVATTGSRILVGEPGGPGRRGRVWRYGIEPDGSIAADGVWEPEGLVDGDWFGRSVAIGAGWEAAGAPAITRRGTFGRVFLEDLGREGNHGD